MDYFSTRGDGPVTLDDALRTGIADDGGLFLPEQMPVFEIADFANTESIPQVAEVLLRPFFEGSVLDDQLEDILAETFSFPMPRGFSCGVPVATRKRHKLTADDTRSNLRRYRRCCRSRIR
jgi:threonine synthase